MSEVASIIATQLCRTGDSLKLALGRLQIMLGAKDFVTGEMLFQFGWKAKAANGANRVRITLDPSDTYIVEFASVRAGKVTIKGTHENVYAEDLKPLFERETGLYLSL